MVCNIKIMALFIPAVLIMSVFTLSCSKNHDYYQIACRFLISNNIPFNGYNIWYDSSNSEWEMNVNTIKNVKWNNKPSNYVHPYVIMQNNLVNKNYIAIEITNARWFELEINCDTIVNQSDTIMDCDTIVKEKRILGRSYWLFIDKRNGEVIGGVGHPLLESLF